MISSPLKWVSLPVVRTSEIKRSGGMRWEGDVPVQGGLYWRLDIAVGSNNHKGFRVLAKAECD